MPEEKKRFTITKTQTIVTLICGLFVIIGTLVGLFKSYDNSIVHMTEFKAFQFQVNEQTLQNRIDFYQRLVWDLEVLYDTTNPLKMGHDVEKYRTALKNLDIATKQLEVMREAIIEANKKDNS